MALLQVIGTQKNGVNANSIYVFGERNSGTNYVHNLIVRNCVVPQTLRRPYDSQNKIRFGWKHGFPNVKNAPDDVLAIAVYREPIAWLHSLCRTPWHTAQHLQGIPFSDFIRAEWQSVMNDPAFGIGPDHPDWGRELLADRDPVSGKRFANAVALRNAKNRDFAALDGQFGNCLHVCYEEVMANPQVFLNALCKNYGFARLTHFDPIIHDRATPARGAFVPKPLPPIQARDLDFILGALDLDQEAALGYDLTPVDAVLRRAA